MKRYRFSLRWKLVMFTIILALITYSTSGAHTNKAIEEVDNLAYELEKQAKQLNKQINQFKVH